MSNQSGVDWKQKYMDLRARFIESLEIGYRSGYEQGASEKQMEMMMQQAQQAQAQAQQMQSQMGQQSQEEPGQPQVGPDEIDSAIAELESLVNKSEGEVGSSLKKSLENLKMIKVTKDFENTLKKSKVKEFSLFPKVSKSYTHNMPSEKKQGVGMQNKIINDIFKKWDSESEKSTKSILDVLGTESNKKD